MHLDQLKYLIEVSKHDTLLSASKQLHLTPQALNISIKNLEKELEMPLLVRNHTGSQLTEAGEEVVKTARTFLQQMYTIQQKHMTLLQTPLEGKVALWTTYGGMEFFLPPLICRAYQQFPGLEIEVFQSTSEDLVKRVQGGDLEFALIYRSVVKDVPTPQFDDDSPLTFHRLFACQVFLQIPQAYEIAHRKSLYISETMDYPWIAFLANTTPPEDNPMVKLLQTFGKPSHPIRVVNSYTLYQQLISSGLGIGLFQTDLLNAQCSVPLEGVNTVAIKDDVSIIFGYVTNDEHPCSALNASFLECLNMYIHFCSLI